MSKVEICVFTAIGLIILMIFLAKPYFEMKTFNDCTGSNATYWNAVFNDLRVFDCHRDKK